MMQKGVDNLKYAACTDRGLVRDNNEDSYRIIEGTAINPYAFIVADGMGGHNCGEVASRMAVDYISEAILKNNYCSVSNTDLESVIRSLVEEANSKVFQRSLENDQYSGMGTTLTMAVAFDGGPMIVAHVGDSRLYQIRSGVIKQITDDHSYIEELVRNGSLTREEAENHPQKNIITRAIGSSETLIVDILNLHPMKNDAYILCTDGLTNKVSKSILAKTVLENDPEPACRQLVEEAIRQGGEDNITVIVIKCE
jgi:protein phosphatase